jgi:hypothetical protein
VKQNTTTIYLIIHELFGIAVDGDHIELVTPVIPTHSHSHGHAHTHTYKIGRFKDGKWQADVKMDQDEVYELKGIAPRQATATTIPCHSEFSPHPSRRHQLSKTKKPFCTWKLSLPRRIHQLRLVSIPECDRPIFAGDPDGDEVESQLSAISLAQAFEYELMSADKFGIFTSKGKVGGLDYQPDKVTNTINLHIWAQLEDESGMSEKEAQIHASEATGALVELFDHLEMEGTKSLSVDNHYSTQLRMPPGVRFPELMTLAEKFTLLGNKLTDDIECTAKTCGNGGNLYIRI